MKSHGEEMGNLVRRRERLLAKIDRRLVRVNAWEREVGRIEKQLALFGIRP